jgi:hypothetical protein
MAAVIVIDDFGAVKMGVDVEEWNGDVYATVKLIWKNGDVAHRWFARRVSARPCPELAPLPADLITICRPNQVPRLGVDAGEPVQARQLRRRNGDSTTKLADESRLVRKDGSGIKGVGRPDRGARLSQEAKYSAPLTTASDVIIGSSMPRAGSTLAASESVSPTDTEFDAGAFVRRDLWRYRPHGSRTPRGIGLGCVENRDGEFGVVQGRNGNRGRRERSRGPDLVVGRVAEPPQGFQGKSNPLQIGMGRIN